MARILALDVGRKRTGVAVTDPLQIVPGGLGYFPTAEIPQRVAQYCEKEQVERIIVGLPRQANNAPSESEQYIQPLIRSLQKKLPHLTIERYDERYTTVMAHQAMLQGGMKKMKRREKGIADEISAVIILQGYLESRQYQQRFEIPNP